MISTCLNFDQNFRPAKVLIELVSSLKMNHFGPFTQIIFFLFSDAKNMARDVNNVLVEIIAEKKNFSQQQAMDYIKSESNYKSNKQSLLNLSWTALKK